MACILAGFFSFQAQAQNQHIADSLINILSSSQNFNDSSSCYLNNEIAFYSTNPSDKIKFALEASKIAKRINDKRQLAVSYRYLGNGNRLKGNLSVAIENYLLAAQQYESIKLSLGVAVVYLDLGDVYSRQDNFKVATKYYKDAISTLRKEKDSIRLASALLNIGDLFLKKERLDSALLLSEESKLIFEQINYSSGVSFALGNIGLIYAKQGLYNEAEKNMNLAIKMLEKLGNRYPIAAYQTALSEIYAQQGDINKALDFSHKALAIGQEEGLKEQIRDASLKLSALYQEQKAYKKAYEYQSQYITYRDSINNEETIRKMADLRTEYEVSKKQAEVDLKQTEVDLLNEQARNNQIVLWSVIVILVLVMGLTYVLLKFYRVKVRAIRIVKKRRKIITAQRNQLAEVNQTKDKFFSIISHDIRGPISNFQGVSQLIQLLVESNDKEALLKLANMLDSSSKEISDLLDNLLEWAMSQQGRMPYKPEEIKLHELCNSNLAIMKNLAAAKKITLNQKVKEKIKIQADKNSVSTIIRNLISNAVKFTPEGGEVELSIGYEVNLAVITVKDNGIGISEEKMQHLFEFKGERSRWGTEGEKGVGLGLTLVHEFVELNKGKIEVDSIVGKGTTFKVFLPLLAE